MQPLQAALKGAEQIASPSSRLTVSLIAVLIPWFHGRLVARLFRESPYAVGHDPVSAVVSLTRCDACAKL